MLISVTYVGKTVYFQQQAGGLKLVQEADTNNTTNSAEEGLNMKSLENVHKVSSGDCKLAHLFRQIYSFSLSNSLLL